MLRILPLALTACLLFACATAGGSRRQASKPLGPLRAFTQKEWGRIRDVQPMVRHNARRHRLSPALVNGMIWVESKFQRRARGRRGPRGLLQLMPRTGKAMARRLGRRYAPYQADFNIAAGVAYLMLMYDRFPRLELALAAYNGGPGAVRSWQRAGHPPPGPRPRYVQKVLRAAHAFCRRLGPGPEPDESPFRCARRPRMDLVARVAAAR